MRSTLHFPTLRVLAAATLALAACNCGDKTVHLAPASIEVSPVSVDLGTVVVGQAADAPIEVRNTGGLPLELTGVQVTAGGDELTVADYLLSDCTGAVRTEGTTLAPATCARFRIRFEPTQAHRVEGAVLLTTNAPSQPTVTINVVAKGIGPATEVCALAADGSVPVGSCSDLRKTPPVLPSLDFGPIRKGASVTRRVRIHNLGQSPLAVTMASLAAGSAAFSLPNPAFAATIEQDGVASMDVTFSPPSTGAYTGKLVLDSNDPIYPKLEIPLLGSGVAGLIRVCPLSADGSLVEATCSRLSDTPPFIPTLTVPATAIGDTGTATLRVFNGGNAALVVSAAALTAGGPELTATASGLPGSLAGGAFADVVVTVTPQNEGALAGTLRLTSDDDAHPVLDVPVAATRIAATLRVCVLRDDGSVDASACTLLRANPPFVPTLDFGHVPWGVRKARLLRVTNDGLAPLYLSPPSLSSLARDFSLTGAVSATLAAGATTDIEVAFAPVSSGALTGEIRLRSNDQLAREVVLPIAGWAEAPKLCVTPVNGLDFSTVTIGTTSKLGLSLKNCGQVPLHLSALAFSPQSPTSREFTATLPAMPAAMAPGDELAFDVTYAPLVQRTDLATLNATHEFDTALVPLRGVGAPPTCQTAAPTASAGPDQTVRPLSTATLDGSRSTFLRGGTLSYSWRLVSQPTNGISQLSDATVKNPSFGATLAGDYEAELVVRDSFGCPSAPDRVVVHVVPDKRVHIQLTWGQSYGDVDLHFIGPGGTFDRSPYDVYFGNKTPDWGLAANNPSLDIDNVWGYGPENVNQNGPRDGLYTVDVHYYCSRKCFFVICGGSYGPATATLKVFIDGVERYSGTRTMKQRDLWEAARVQVSGNGSRIDVVELTGALSMSGTLDACTGDVY